MDNKTYYKLLATIMTFIYLKTITDQTVQYCLLTLLVTVLVIIVDLLVTIG